MEEGAAPLPLSNVSRFALSIAHASSMLTVLLLEQVGPGQELSEHTAAKPAMLFFVKGEASVGLGDDVQEAQAGTWVHMPANLKHSIKAKTPVVMLLVLLK